ncbi:MAG: thioredoxin-disulfide reductase [Acidobacteriota bacterium]
MKDLLDIIIIGAGPAGLTAAIYAGRSRTSAIVMEKSAPGGTIILSDIIENYPGYPEPIPPFELMDKFRMQAEKFGASIVYDEAKKIEKNNFYWKVIGNDGEYLGKAVIVATGTRHKKLGIHGEKEFTGKGVSYCAVCDGPFYKDKEIVVVGCGNSGIQEGLFLLKFVKKITFVEFLPQMTAEKILQERIMEKNNVEIFLNHELLEINGRGKIESVKIRERNTNKIKEINAHGVFIYVGLLPNSEFIKDIVKTDDYGYIITDNNLQTSEPGIFVAGDVRAGAFQQVAVSVGDGATAAHNAIKYIEDISPGF